MCINRIVAVVAVVLLGLSEIAFYSNADNEYSDISAKSAIAYSPDTGEVVFEKNADEKLPMASTTKIMTALITAEQCDLDRLITVTQEDISVEGSSSGLRAGDCITVADLIYCMLLPSGNDAANIGARITAGNQQKFAALMNERAVHIGMKNTSFVTPSGLDSEGHFSTAHDMALLTQEAVKNDFLRTVFASYTHTVETSAGVKYYLTNHNRLLKNIEGCKGVKTGFTKKSGRCLVTYTERDSLSLVVVTLNAPDDWADHSKIIETAFSTVYKFKPEPDLSTVKAKITGADVSRISVVASLPEIKSFSDISGEIKMVIYIMPFMYAPVAQGDKCGEVKIFYKNRTIYRGDICAAASAQCANPPEIKNKKMSFREQIKAWFGRITE